MEDFVAYQSRWSLAFQLLMIVAVFLSGLLMLGVFGPPPHSGRAIFVIGWCFVLFSCFSGFVTINDFLDPSEQLSIGPNGIRFADWSEDTIPWSEITRVTIPDLRMYRGNRKVIVLYLRNPDRFSGRGWTAFIAAANRPATGGDIPLRLDGTNRSFKDAISAIQRFSPVS